MQVIGTLVHGQNPNAQVFLNTEFAGDTNANIECLRRVLKTVADTRRASGKDMPSHLYFQMDNTSKYNKNKK